MAKFRFKGLDEYVAKLESLSRDAEEHIGKAVYDGAAIVANRVKSAISDLPVAQTYARDGEMIRTITSAQKAGLMSGFGIARMQKDGSYYNVKLGFDGYNGQKTKKYPSGQPNSMIARSVISGTSFRAPNDFMSRAVSGAKGPCEAAMKKALEEAINQQMN